MAETAFRHTLSYPDNHNITLSEIAATLVAQEKLLPIAAEVLENLYSGLIVEKITINLDFVQRGSLQEAFFVAIFIAYQKDLDKAVPKMVEQLTGVQVTDDLKPVLSVLFIVMLYTGIKLLTNRLSKAKPEAPDRTPTINGDYNTVINAASLSFGVQPAELETAVRSTLSPKRKGILTRSTIDLIKPAKRGGPGRIISDGAPEVSRGFISEFPDAAALAELEEGTEVDPYPTATLEIRATDRDKADRGWFGRLHAGDMSTGRLSLKLSSTVDRDALAKRDAVKIEALVESRRLDDDSLKPIRIHVLSVLN